MVTYQVEDKGTISIDGTLASVFYITTPPEDNKEPLKIADMRRYGWIKLRVHAVHHCLNPNK